MLRATVCPSSGETIVFLRHLVLVILCGWLSGMQGTPCIPESSIEYDCPCIPGYTLHTRQSSVQCDCPCIPESHPYSMTVPACQDTPCIPESSIEYDGPFILGYTLHTRQSSIQNNKFQVSHKHSCFSWWWAHRRPKHVQKRNKHTKKICITIWLYIQDYTGMHGQQNIKYRCLLCVKLSVPKSNYSIMHLQNAYSLITHCLVAQGVTPKSTNHINNFAPPQS